MIRVVAFAVTVTLALTAWAAFATTPVAAQGRDGVCTDADGVTVVVDFHELGGGVNVRCAPWTPGMTGFGALQAAGINHQTAVRFPGFLCKIAGQPADDRCIDTSPASAYWSYWVAPRGGSWCYANWGAGNRQVPRGGVEGWSFSFQRTASTSPTPRFGVPGPIPGVSPAPLAGNDCDPTRTAPAPGPSPSPSPAPSPSPSPAPTATPTPAPSRHATPTPPQATPPTAATPNAPPVVPGAGVAPDSSSPVDGSGTPGAPGGTADDSTPADPTTEDAQVLDDTADTARDEGGRDDGERDESAIGAVDLTSDGSERSSTPIGAMVVLAVVLALGGGAVVLNRRRAADPG